MRFHDRHEHLQYLKAEFVARRIVDTPAVIDEARAFIDRFWRDDPHAAHYLAIWDELLTGAPAEIADRLTEDTPRGQYLRETCPPFGVITARQVAELLDGMAG
ncbi:hypothetical protein [Falsiroseomonas sp. HW251]|uniref:hypothetical protein n=1 Tax=Falsiroseomonas sp. HW251 TaxID=3390998 RepID=UPI003D316CD5